MDTTACNFKIFMVYYDGTELMPKMMNLTQFDLIDIKGVFNILSLNKLSLVRMRE